MFGYRSGIGIDAHHARPENCNSDDAEKYTKDFARDREIADRPLSRSRAVSRDTRAKRSKHLSCTHLASKKNGGIKERLGDILDI